MSVFGERGAGEAVPQDQRDGGVCGEDSDSDEVGDEEGGVECGPVGCGGGRGGGGVVFWIEGIVGEDGCVACGGVVVVG